jgi:ribosome-binding protein aMBF1 (putative translation factor)
MNCERCLKGGEVRYRVYTAAMEMAVCAACADEAREPETTVEPRSQE